MLVPAAVVTVTWTVPADPAGAMAVIWVGEFMVNVVAVLPNLTVVGPVNPVPVIVTLVPPDVGPDVGEMEVIVGMAEPPRRCGAGCSAPDRCTTGFAGPLFH
ncbi:hypothetical protein IFM12275_08000 [Nocardia sputorum]|uniref:Uncharacterized protein n=1 Tax=Nocardia sputorum TaxID=2984338 RepID=A0ABN6U2N1_9NOCA|nr:hypothetical protein IFM12275_08000 [Nocardia sputorum]BDT99452.1 hypothetical protein IFM12276_24810 [Nocardia sputorum]